MASDLFDQFDDESFALQLQLQETEAQRELQSGKWPEGRPPDSVLAFDEFHAELKKAILLAQDLKLAHSIGESVDSDAVAIEESSTEETESVHNRRSAISLNENANLPSQEVTDLPEMSPFEAENVPGATEASTSSMDSSDHVAGPSANHALHQRAVTEHVPELNVECSVCGETITPHDSVRLVCTDVYCKPCLRSFFLRVAKDESLFPPKCHRQLIEISTIEADFSIDELTAYRAAELEFTSTDRVYCANPECAKFIPMSQRTADRAYCGACWGETCMYCKARAHDGDCPPDEAMQSLIDFANEQGWKSCFGCGEMVFRYEGCDHMTCRCGTQFCYRCGTKWKECQCGDWVPELLDRRAQQIVDREARRPLAPAIRQQRVVAMAREVQRTHECDHMDRFTKVEGTGRGMVCEICRDMHFKYILSCPRCHLLACEDCLRYRLRAL